ncbi:putative aspartyl protease [Duganella sp. 1224]|uniref:retroviral-like aspartic protease family protein n=1 Tax=Duganella sp. 1224 TaxID=2587052 RepID=UPI0015C84724|nr:retroviral-like aspartic protease family protein [Duganella sp. 1224]NYE61010.1 putative aspartyl protease [Duganella sp. 1224]
MTTRPLPLHATLGLLLAFALTPARAGCEYTELAAMQVSYPGNQNLPAIQGEINGKQVNMVLDTGSYRTFMLRSEMERQFVEMRLLRQTTAGIGGKAATFTARLKEVAVGPARVKQADFAVLDALEWSGFGALVGADFLTQADLELELADNRIRFLRFHDCGDHTLAYWSTDADRVALQARPYSKVPLVEVRVNGQSMLAAIDTGATVSILDQRAAERLGVKPDSPGSRPAGKTAGVGAGSRPLWRATFDSFAIGEEQIQHPTLTVVDRTDDAGLPRQLDYDMVLGRDFLKTHRVLLANSQQRVYFTYLGGRVFAEPDA